MQRPAYRRVLTGPSGGSGEQLEAVVKTGEIGVEGDEWRVERPGQREIGGVVRGQSEVDRNPKRRRRQLPRRVKLEREVGEEFERLEGLRAAEYVTPHEPSKRVGELDPGELRHLHAKFRSDTPSPFARRLVLVDERTDENGRVKDRCVCGASDRVPRVPRESAVQGSASRARA